MRRAARWAFGAFVVAHLVALYWPRADLPGMVLDSDKLGHALLFGLPALASAVALPRRWVLVTVAALIAHAPLSEWLQSAVLPQRSGDPRDALADLVGVLVGALLGWAWMRRLDRRDAGRSRAGARW